MCSEPGAGPYRGRKSLSVRCEGGPAGPRRGVAPAGRSPSPVPHCAHCPDGPRVHVAGLLTGHPTRSPGPRRGPEAGHTTIAAHCRRPCPPGPGSRRRRASGRSVVGERHSTRPGPPERRRRALSPRTGSPGRPETCWSARRRPAASWQGPAHCASTPVGVPGGTGERAIGPHRHARRARHVGLAVVAGRAPDA